MSNKLKTFTNGIIKENPVLVLVLGTCPTIATSTSVLNALGMGLAATFVLLGSNIVISLLRNITPIRSAFPASSLSSPASFRWCSCCFRPMCRASIRASAFSCRLS